MARVPVDATLGTQRAFQDLNDEIRKLTDKVSSISLFEVSHRIEELESDVKKLAHLRRIPDRGHRVGTSLGPFFLNDSLFWSNPNAQSVAVTVSLISTSQAVTADMYIILVDATGGNVTVTLPAAVAQSGRYLQIKKIDDSANKVIIDPVGSDTIDGDPFIELLYDDEAVELASNGTDDWSVF